MVSAYARVVIDVGTGDGSYVLDRAAREPRTFVVGVDANETSMREAARRAGSKAARGGRANALFVLAAAEALGELAGSADEVVVQFPWGSLLRGMLGHDESVLSSVGRVLRPGGTVNVLVSLVERDGVVMPDEAELRAAYERAGLTVESFAQVDAAEVAAVRSAWARRLGAGSRRPVWRVTARR